MRVLSLTPKPFDFFHDEIHTLRKVELRFMKFGWGSTGAPSSRHDNSVGLNRNLSSHQRTLVNHQSNVREAQKESEE